MAATVAAVAARAREQGLPGHKSPRERQEPQQQHHRTPQVQEPANMALGDLRKQLTKIIIILVQ